MGNHDHPDNEAIEWRSEVFQFDPATAAHKATRCYLQIVKNIEDLKSGKSIKLVQWQSAGVATKKVIDPGYKLCAAVMDPDGAASEPISGPLIYDLSPPDTTQYFTLTTNPWRPVGGFRASPVGGEIFKLEPEIARADATLHRSAISRSGYTTTIGVQDGNGKLVNGIQLRSYVGLKNEAAFTIETAGETIKKVSLLLALSEPQIALIKADRSPGVALTGTGLIEIRIGPSGKSEFYLGTFEDQAVTSAFATVQATNADNEIQFTFFAPIIVPIKAIPPLGELREMLWKR